MMLENMEIKNIESINKLIRGHIFCNITDEANFILNNHEASKPYNWDMVENLTIDNSTEITEWEHEIDFYEECIEESNYTYDDGSIDRYKDKIDEIEDTIRELKTENGEIKKIKEWWKVSPFLAHILIEWGEVIIPNYNIWGRVNNNDMEHEEVLSYIAKELKLH